MGRYGYLVQGCIASVFAIGFYFYCSNTKYNLSDEEAVKKFGVSQSEIDERRKSTQLLMDRLKKEAGIKDK